VFATARAQALRHYQERLKILNAAISAICSGEHPPVREIRTCSGIQSRSSSSWSTISGHQRRAVFVVAAVAARLLLRAGAVFPYLARFGERSMHEVHRVRGASTNRVAVERALTPDPLS